MSELKLHKRPQMYDEEYPNVFEKWLRSRLNYAVISVTGEPATPGFIDAVVAGGSCKYQAGRGLRDELWVKNRYPHSDFFGNRVVKFKYPPQVTEVLDCRFSQDPLNKPEETMVSTVWNPMYHVSLHELATVPSWGPPSIAPEHLPCYQESPYSEAQYLRPVETSNSFQARQQQLLKWSADRLHPSGNIF